MCSKNHGGRVKAILIKSKQKQICWCHCPSDDLPWLGWGQVEVGLGEDQGSCGPSYGHGTGSPGHSLQLQHTGTLWCDPCLCKDFLGWVVTKHKEIVFTLKTHE